MSVQYRVVVGKKDERVDGDDASDVVFSVPVAVAASAGFDASVEFMRGRVKATGFRFSGPRWTACSSAIERILRTSFVDVALRRGRSPWAATLRSVIQSSTISGVRSMSRTEPSRGTM